MIITERLILRPFELSDVDDFYEYAKNPNIGKNAGWEPHKIKEESLQIIKQFQKTGGEYAIVFKQSNKVIGSLGLQKDTKRTVANAMSIGYSISEDFWGYGLMTEAVKSIIKYAFEEKMASVLTINHFPFNKRSKRVIEKCDFRYEGRLRCAYQMFDGNVYDELCYSILREEYFLRKLANT